MTTRLARVAKVRYGLGQPPSSSDTGVPIIRATNIERGKITTGGLVRARLEDLPLDRAPLLDAGEILVVRSGAYTGDSARVTAEWAGSAPGYDLRVTPNATVANDRYLAWFLLSQAALDQMHVASTRAAQPHLNAEELADLRLHVPPLLEQRRIADFLDDQVARIDTIIAAREGQLEALDSSILAIAHALVTGRERAGGRGDTGIPWAPTLPDGWGAPRVGQVARMGTGHTPSRSEPSYWQHCNIQWLTTGDVHRFRHDEIDAIDETVIQISELGLANSAAVLHPRGTVALSRTASAGFSIVMAAEMATSQDFATWTPGPLLHAEYLLWCLRAMRRDLMGRLAMGSTHKTIYFPELMSIRIPLPTVVEQRAIAARVETSVAEVRRGIVAVTDAIELLREYKQSLITAVVTGEFDVATARREVPS